MGDVDDDGGELLSLAAAARLVRRPVEEVAGWANAGRLPWAALVSPASGERRLRSRHLVLLTPRRVYRRADVLRVSREEGQP